MGKRLREGRLSESPGRSKMDFGGSPGLWEGPKWILEALRVSGKVQNGF
jgi:hypothetical protein